MESVQLIIILMNFIYAAGGAFLALAFMVLGYKVFDRLTPFDTSKQLAEGNRAVGTVIGSIFVGLGIAVGLVVANALN